MRRVEPLTPDPWIGAFVSLGSRLRRYADTVSGRQLVVAVSVPRRDYAAALIGGRLDALRSGAGSR